MGHEAVTILFLYFFFYYNTIVEHLAAGVTVTINIRKKDIIGVKGYKSNTLLLMYRVYELDDTTGRTA